MGQKGSRSRQPNGKQAKHISLLERINLDAAGIDCGSESHYVAVPPERDSDPVRTFKAFTGDLHRLADWLQACKIKSVALESTGVYWIPIFEILEDRGFEVVLVNSRHIKNVPGRKTDVLDCQWIQQLHSVGLLRGSFRPAAEITSLRAYLRHRDKLVQSAASHVQRMQKALVQMNLQLHNVISDITGVTGMHILRDIVAGVTDPVALAAHRDYRCRASQDEIVASLTGNYRAEHLFILRQHLELFDTFQRHIQTCDGEIESLLHKLAAKQSTPKTPVPAPRSKPRFYDNEPRFEIRDPLYRLAGADLTQIDAIGPYTALKIIAEIGTDMSRWPTYKHFTSWLTLAPRTRSPAAGSSARRRSPRPTEWLPSSACVRWSWAAPPPRSARTTGASLTASASPRRSRPPLASSPSSSTALSRATWTTRTPAPRPTKMSTEPEPCRTCAIGPGSSASHSSTSTPGSYSKGQFLRRQNKQGGESTFC